MAMATGHGHWPWPGAMASGHGRGPWLLASAKDHGQGPPHPHLWLSLVLAVRGDPDLPDPLKAAIAEYGAQWQGKAPLLLCTELKAFRSKTCFDQKWVNLFVTPVAGTPSHQLWAGMRAYLLTKGTMMRDGMAPQRPAAAPGRGYAGGSLQVKGA